MNSKEVIMTETLGDILLTVEELPNPENGWYSLFVPVEDNESTLNENTRSAIIFISDDEERGFIPAYAKANNLQSAIDVWLLQDIVSQAFDHRPGANQKVLTEALKYYLLNDAYIDWDAYQD